MAAWCRKTLKFCENFLRFFGKTTTYGKIFKLLFQDFSSWHRLSCSNLVKFTQREIGEVVSEQKNKISPASQTVATAPIAPKMCEGQPPTMYSEYPSAVAELLVLLPWCANRHRVKLMRRISFPTGLLFPTPTLRLQQPAPSLWSPRCVNVKSVLRIQPPTTQ